MYSTAYALPLSLLAIPLSPQPPQPAPPAPPAPPPPPAPTVAADPLPSVTLPADLDQVLRNYERAWRTNDIPVLVSLFTEGWIRPPARATAGAWTPGTDERLPRSGRRNAEASRLGLRFGRYGRLHHWRLRIWGYSRRSGKVYADSAEGRRPMA